MEEKITEKKAWESPEVEIINSKLTSGGSWRACVETAGYYDSGCGYGS